MEAGIDISRAHRQAWTCYQKAPNKLSFMKTNLFACRFYHQQMWVCISLVLNDTVDHVRAWGNLFASRIADYNIGMNIEVEWHHELHEHDAANPHSFYSFCDITEPWGLNKSTFSSSNSCTRFCNSLMEWHFNFFFCTGFPASSRILPYSSRSFLFTRCDGVSAVTFFTIFSNSFKSRETRIQNGNFS